MDKPSETMLKLIEESPSLSIQDLLEAVNAETVYYLMQHFGGLTIFIPKIDKLQASERNENIKKDYFSGLTYSQLCKKYGLSDRRLRSIINGGKNEKDRAKPTK